MNIDRQLHRQGESPNRAIGVGADAMPYRVAGKLIENEHRPALFRRQLR
jgi:hypothetical protein